jgi:hypothetical protein
MLKVLHNSIEELQYSHFMWCVNYATIPKSYVTTESFYQLIFTSKQNEYLQASYTTIK